MNDPRPRWRNKRWAAALALWLAVSYPLSHLPFAYLLGRHVIPDSVGTAVSVVYLPIGATITDQMGRPTPGLGWYVRLLYAARAAGERHYGEASL